MCVFVCVCVCVCVWMVVFLPNMLYRRQGFKESYFNNRSTRVYLIYANYKKQMWNMRNEIRLFVTSRKKRGEIKHSDSESITSLWQLLGGLNSCGCVCCWVDSPPPPPPQDISEYYYNSNCGGFGAGWVGEGRWRRLLLLFFCIQCRLCSFKDLSQQKIKMKNQHGQ